ncbi:MAG: tetratricopeptide repeat protein [Xanthomonadales bacterium]|jgi:predicted TPR repeat methyltransferase|nr:tetratricopeptide repeat protein [Xanthomonadales bacterium]
MERHRSGDLAGARKLYRKLLRKSPNHPAAMNLLGLVNHHQGDAERAEDLFRQAIEIAPTFHAAWRNLGNALVSRKAYEEARECYERALELGGEDSSLLSNYCVALRCLGAGHEAITAGRRATELDPERAFNWYNLGNAYRVQGKHAEAIRCFHKTLTLEPAFTPGWDAYCRSTLAREQQSFLGRRTLGKTRRAYREWLAQEPENPIAQFLLMSIEEKAPGRVPDQVLQKLFDPSAGTFDEHLGKLGYRAPAMIEALLAASLESSNGTLDVLDGGCGTGLCGAFLRSHARRLIGVDLSEGMLARARSTGHYDELIQAELTAWLAAAVERFDLVVLADTLCYFGEITDLLRGTHRVLSPGGTLVFTVERSPSDSSPFLLHPHGRFSHTESYVKATLSEVGLTLVSLATDTIRLETGAPVAGLLVMARKEQ